MCFSAEADLVAGVAVGAAGIDALRHVRQPAERPLAAIPMVLGAHQLVEAVVWWGLRDEVPDHLGRAAAWLYLAVAFAVVPVLVPVAVGALEPAGGRRWMRGFTALGLAVAAVLLFALLRGPVEAHVDGYHIAYRVDVGGGGLMAALYVVATCGALLTSRHAHVRWFGATNLAAVVVLTWLDRGGLISLWCAWAAVTSVAIALHLRYLHQPPGGVAART